MVEYRVDTSKHPAPGFVAVGRETIEDLGLGTRTKKARATSGNPHLPGGSFGRPTHDVYWKKAVQGGQKERENADKKLSVATHQWNLAVRNKNPSVNAAVGTLRQTKSDGNIEPYITHENSGYKYEAPSHIASTRTSSSTTDEVYDYRKHGWYHDVTRKKLGVNRPNVETEEWAQLIKKSKDHIGYGNGMIGYGDVQSTSLAPDAPSWMFGMRMVPGVVGSGMPRWQYCMVEEDPKTGKGILNTQMRYFQRGPNMSTIETVGGAKPVRNDRSIIDFRQPLPASRKPDINRVSDKRQSGMQGTGAVVKPVIMPPSNHHVVEPDFRLFRNVERY
mmetsp:Transcript_22256/g.56191  ORF Transcript_22256/g.56191 Transcript_22256/m.56191 type:complete len:332 (+) Transcript_22256:68-1063(+)|eukprot:CAMPEP_0178984944 /NCGR_PEP_ID=MMETSP0795-20121207/1890_1 /TAXON_ID=88552 /ORGANISM="Amoebophrya sp., Strain Ameob2" /LENGTH=331 /DNA_ID=CAMNT_0020675871 /DNA_START=15 /DNA_END=1010 /DNA_ORIENTATION=-